MNQIPCIFCFKNKICQCGLKSFAVNVAGTWQSSKTVMSALSAGKNRYMFLHCKTQTKPNYNMIEYIKISNYSCNFASAAFY